MDAYQLDRHFKRWDENNKLIKRVTFATLAISIALIVKVLTPFVDGSESKRPVLENIAALTQQQADATRKIQIIEKTESVLQEVNRFIAAQPWQKEKNALIQRYRRMNAEPSRSGHSQADYQAEADQTIKVIGAMLREQVLAPLRKAMESADQHMTVANLNDEVGSLARFIDAWEERYIGKNWYRTLNLKEATMHDLTRDLNQRMQDFAAAIERELARVKQARKAADAKLATLNHSIDLQADRLKDIEKALQDVLPSWLRGLVSTEQVIQFLPLYLLGSAVYVFFLGMSLTRHFRTYAAGKGLTPDITGDPAMSSTWTLIARGRYGTLLSIAAYLVFFALVWVLLEKATGLLEDWLSLDPVNGTISNSNTWEAFRWLCRFVLLTLAIYVVAKPWGQHTAPNRERETGPGRKTP